MPPHLRPLLLALAVSLAALAGAGCVADRPGPAAPPGPSDDALEPNDAPGTAARLDGPRVAVDLVAADADWVRLPVRPLGRVVLRLTAPRGDARATVQAVVPARPPLQEGRLGPAPAERAIEWTIEGLAPGEDAVLVSIVPDPAAPAFGYRLEADVLGPDLVLLRRRLDDLRRAGGPASAALLARWIAAHAAASQLLGSEAAAFADLLLAAGRCLLHAGLTAEARAAFRAASDLGHAAAAARVAEIDACTAGAPDAYRAYLQAEASFDQWRLTREPRLAEEAARLCADALAHRELLADGGEPVQRLCIELADEVDTALGQR